MRKKFSIDRIESGIAVCFDEDGNKYEFQADRIGLARGSLFEAELAGTEPSDVVYLEEETKQTKKDMKARLDRLFRRSAK